MKKLISILLTFAIIFAMPGMFALAEVAGAALPSSDPVLSETFATVPYLNGPNGTASVENNILTMVKDKAGSNFNVIIWSDSVDDATDETFTVTFEAELTGGYIENTWDGYAVALRKTSGGDTELVRMVPSQYGTIITKGAGGEAMETASSGWHTYKVVFNRDLNKYSLLVDDIPYVQNGDLGWNGTPHGFYIKNGHNDATNCTLKIKNFNVYTGNIAGDVLATEAPTEAPTADPNATPTPTPTDMPTDAEFKLTGTIFGTAATSTNYFNYALDGSTSTVFGGTQGGFCGIDLGIFQAAVTKIRLFPRSNNGDMTSRHIGAEIQGANGVATISGDGTIDDSQLQWETIYTFTSAPTHNAWNEYTYENFDLLRKYRYVRYKAADSEYAAVAEIEFYCDPTVEIQEPYELTGTTFGSAADYENAFDDDETIGSEGSLDGYVGMDLGEDNNKIITQISYYPLSGSENSLVGAQFQVGKGEGTIDADGTLSGDITWVTIYTISEEPADGEWFDIPYTEFNALKAYRYVRLVAADGGYSPAGELKFWVDPGVQITPEFEVDKGELLYTIGCISDTHIDAGIERQEFPMRQTAIDTCNTIAQDESANVMLLTGDITSDHCGGSYNAEVFANVQAAIRQTLNGATESGRTLYVNGNHEYAAGETDFNSGDYTWIMKEDVGEFDHALYMDEEEKYLLAYHYVIDGLDFIGVNTPYTGGENHGAYEITQSSIDFVEDVLEEIGPERLVIFACHYPLNDSRGISSSGKGMTNSNNINNNLKAVLNEHPNLIYVYGHDHGGAYIQNDTFERVTPYRADGSIITNKSEIPDGFVSSFVGSMCYYGSGIRHDGTTYSGIFSYGPPLVQGLIIYVYDNCVELQIKNYGVINGESEVVASYTIPRSFSILGMVYDVDETEMTITNLPEGTTIGDLLEVAEVGDFTVEVQDANGLAISDENTVVAEGMKLSRIGANLVPKVYSIVVEEEPTAQPTEAPTEAPSTEPTSEPTEVPTEAPSDDATETPSAEPTSAPTEGPQGEAERILMGDIKIYVGSEHEIDTEDIDITVAEFEWTSSDETVATVSAEGTLQALKKGSASIEWSVVLESGATKVYVWDLTVKTSSGGGGGYVSPTDVPTAVPTEAPTEIPDSKKEFTDVSDADWFYDAVMGVADLGYMQGVSETEFDPNGELTRAQAAMILWRIFGEPAPNPVIDRVYSFDDVDMSAWYADAIQWACSYQIMKGYNFNTFAPDNSLTREEAAVILYRLTNGLASEDFDWSEYSDAENISDWAKDAIAWCLKTGLYEGVGEGMIAPKAVFTRAQAATLILRVQNLAPVAYLSGFLAF